MGQVFIPSSWRCLCVRWGFNFEPLFGTGYRQQDEADKKPASPDRSDRREQCLAFRGYLCAYRCLCAVLQDRSFDILFKPFVDLSLCPGLHTVKADQLAQYLPWRDPRSLAADGGLGCRDRGIIGGRLGIIFYPFYLAASALFCHCLD